MAPQLKQDPSTECNNRYNNREHLTVYEDLRGVLRSEV